MQERTFDKVAYSVRYTNDGITIHTARDTTRSNKRIFQILLYIQKQRSPAYAYYGDTLVAVNRYVKDLKSQFVISTLSDVLNTTYYYIGYNVKRYLGQLTNSYKMASDFVHISEMYFPQGGVMALIKLFAEAYHPECQLSEAMYEYEDIIGWRHKEHYYKCPSNNLQELGFLRGLELLPDTQNGIDYSSLMEVIETVPCRWKESILPNHSVYLC